MQIKYDDWRKNEDMEATLTWNGSGLLLAGTASDTHSTVQLASGLDEGAEGFRPMELMAIGLGGCTAMDVLSILQKKRQDVRDFQVRVQTRAKEEHPKVWKEVHIEYLVTGVDIDPAAVERAMELSRERYCPAQNMINKAVDIQLSYKILAPA
jgi:putative redox protein